MKNHAILCAALILALALGVGCRAVNTTQRETSNASPNVVADKRVIKDGTLKARISIVEVREAKVGSDLLKIQVELHNNSGNRQAINYKFEWIDDSGMMIQSNLSTWKQTAFEGRETKMVAGVAPTPKAVDFVLKLMEVSNK